jgi:Na+-driven multidrug efflux pump
MVALDVGLIGAFGAVGAGIASVVASGVGLLIAVEHYRRQSWDRRTFLPRWRDAQDLAAYIRTMVSPAREAAAGSR